MLTVKPLSASTHGGGIIQAFTPQRVAIIHDWIAQQPNLNLGVITAIRVNASTRPQLDGYSNEALWRTSKTMALPIGGGWAAATEVTMQSAYDDEHLYILLRWFDRAASIKRDPWLKLTDGSWIALPAKPTPPAGMDWATFMGENFDPEGSQFHYEDKASIIWNTYDGTTIAGFDEAGCAVLCHDPAKNFGPGNTYNYTDQNLAAKKYTNAANEIGDMWHWKLVRNNQHQKLDDQHVAYWQPGMSNPANGGRFSDTGGGGYGSNPATNGRPMYRGPKIDAPPFYILDSEKIVLTESEAAALPVGTMIANMITTGPTGQRADVDAIGRYNPANMTWTLEIRRKLVTGDTKDVQFDDLDREYAFGVAIFDNAQIEHSWTPTVYRLIFGQ